MAAIVKEEPPDLTEANNKIPPQLERMVGRCLEKQPTRRCQTASDLGFALEALLTPSGSRLQAEAAAPATETLSVLPRRDRREQWWMAATALVTLLAAGFAWAYFTRPSAPEARPLKLSLSLRKR